MIQRDFGDVPPAGPGRITATGKPAHLHFEIVFLNDCPHRFVLPVPDFKPHCFKQLAHLPSPLWPKHVFDILFGNLRALVFQDNHHLLDQFAPGPRPGRHPAKATVIRRGFPALVLAFDLL